MYQNVRMYEQSCNLWKWKKVLKQCEGNIFKCNPFMLSILFIYIVFMLLAIKFEIYNNIDSKTKALFTLCETF